MMTRTVWVCKIEGSYILLLRGFILVSSRLLLQCWDVSIWLTFTLFFFSLLLAGWLVYVSAICMYMGIIPFVRCLIPFLSGFLAAMKYERS